MKKKPGDGRRSYYALKEGVSGFSFPGLSACPEIVKVSGSSMAVPAFGILMGTAASSRPCVIIKSKRR